MISLMTNKTIKDINFDYILNSINPITGYGREVKKNNPPFFPGQEKQLIKELDKVEAVINLKEKTKIITILNHIKNLIETIERAKENITLDIVEIFEVKNFLLQLEKINFLLKDSEIAKFEDLSIHTLPNLFKKLDPRNEKLKTFSIYDEFSEKLVEIRRKKRHLKQEIKAIKKRIKEEIKSNYKIKINLKDEIIISKNEHELIDELKEDDRLVVSGENYLNLIFKIKNNHQLDLYEEELNILEISEEKEELKIRKKITGYIKEDYKKFKMNFSSIGRLDYLLEKARFAIRTNSIKPKIINNHKIRIKNGRNIKLEEILKEKNKVYTPVSINLNCNVTCITGANMGGKTVSLKMIGQVAAMAHYGMFVPCEKAEIGLSNFIFISTGDNQSIEKGLSSFGAEIIHLKVVLDKAYKRGLILIDELAGGTNPKEGFAITKSIINFLNRNNSISVITTHFDNAANGKNIQNLQVAGLSEIKEGSFSLKNISDFMNYKLIKAKHENEVPKDALKIAELIGLNKEIIKEAEKHLNS